MSKFTVENIKDVDDVKLRVLVSLLNDWRYRGEHRIWENDVTDEYHQILYTTGMAIKRHVGFSKDLKHVPPDFVNDLNEVNYYEISMPGYVYDTYWNNLVSICVRKGVSRMNSASARLRCEALIVTLQHELPDEVFQEVI